MSGPAPFPAGPAEQEFGQLPAILDAGLPHDAVCQADQQEGAEASRPDRYDRGEAEPAFKLLAQQPGFLLGPDQDLAVVLEEPVRSQFENNARQGCRLPLKGDGELSADVSAPARVTGDGCADLVRSDGVMPLGQTRDGDGPVEQRLGPSRAVDSNGREGNIVGHHGVQGRVDDDPDVLLDDDLADGL